MLRISLKGLNHNRGHIPNSNGEVFTVNYVLNNLIETPPKLILSLFGKAALHEGVYDKGVRPVIFDVRANKGQYLSMLLKQIK